MELNDNLIRANVSQPSTMEGMTSTARAQRPDSRVVRLRQADVSRVVKGVKAAGVSVSQIEVGLDGSIVITSNEAQGSAPRDEYANWKAKRNARAA
jgi:hypothetical protein